MSLLDQLPHECTIQRRTRALDGLGGNVDSQVVERTGVECWEQQMGASEVADYMRRGMKCSRKVYFTYNPQVTERHEIIITKRNGEDVAEANQLVLTVISVNEPDASVGAQLLWKVACDDWSALR